MTMRQRKSSSQAPNQVLFLLLEKRLYHSNSSKIDKEDFIQTVVNDYLVYLRRSRLAIPKAFEEAVIEELRVLVKEMLIKKIYGFYSIEEFQNANLGAHGSKRVNSKKNASSR